MTEDMMFLLHEGQKVVFYLVFPLFQLQKAPSLVQGNRQY